MKTLFQNRKIYLSLNRKSLHHEGSFPENNKLSDFNKITIIFFFSGAIQVALKVHLEN